MNYIKGVYSKNLLPETGTFFSFPGIAYKSYQISISRDYNLNIPAKY